MERTQRITQHLTGGSFEDTNRNAVGLKANDLFSVKGKVALVTGGTKGIGKMMATTLIANGAKVYVCSRKEKLCIQVAEELNKYANEIGSGGSAVSLPGDLSSLDGVISVAERLSKLESHLNILINNAGATWGAPLEEYPDEAWEKVMNLNVRHLFNLTQKLLPLLKKGSVVGDPGRVVNIASVDGVRASQTFGPTAAFAYTTSKGAVVHLTKALCRALSPFQITVNCIAPGVFPSNMTKFMLNSNEGQEVMNNSNPLKRVGRTADIGGTALYLCSPAGSWTNGAIIPLDGGQFLHSEIFPQH